MGPKAIQRPTAKKKPSAAPHATSGARARTSVDSEKKKATGHDDAENVPPEDVDEIVKSLISAVISKVEGDFVEDTEEQGDAAVRKTLSEPPQGSDVGEATEERRRRIERGDSEAKIEEILQHVFTVPTTSTNPVKKKSTTKAAAKPTASEAPSKPPRPMKMQGPHQNSAKSAPKPVNPVKSSTKAVPKKTGPPQTDAPKKPVPDSEEPKEAPQVQEQEEKQPQPPARPKLMKQPSKATSKKPPVMPVVQQSEQAPAPLKEEANNADRERLPVPKVSSRQSSSNKLQLTPADKSLDIVKNPETAATTTLQPKAENKGEKPTSGKTSVKPSVKSTTVASKTNAKNPVPVKRPAPPTKTSKS